MNKEEIIKTAIKEALAAAEEVDVITELDRIYSDFITAQMRLEKALEEMPEEPPRGVNMALTDLNWAKGRLNWLIHKIHSPEKYDTWTDHPPTQ